MSMKNPLHDVVTLVKKCSKVKIINSEVNTCRSQWSRCLRRRFLAARLLYLGFDSRGRHGCLCLVNVVCCAGRGLCDRPIPRPEESYIFCICHSV